jgi:hypothetical protein
VIRRSATQTFGTGWNEYTERASSTRTPRLPSPARTHHAADRGVHGPEGRRHQADLTATDVADPGKTVAGGVTLTLEESRDGRPGHRRAGGPALVSQLIATTWSRVAPLDRVRR